MISHDAAAISYKDFEFEYIRLWGSFGEIWDAISQLKLWAD